MLWIVTGNQLNYAVITVSQRDEEQGHHVSLTQLTINEIQPATLPIPAKAACRRKARIHSDIFRSQSISTTAGSIHQIGAKDNALGSSWNIS